MSFFGAICTVPTVERVGLANSDDLLDVWILLGKDDEAEEERIYHHLQVYRAGGGAPSVDAHVIAPDEGPHAFPGDVAIVFDRA
jgi:hypothetical protein